MRLLGLQASHSNGLSTQRVGRFGGVEEMVLQAYRELDRALEPIGQPQHLLRFAGHNVARHPTGMLRAGSLGTSLLDTDLVNALLGSPQEISPALTCVVALTAFFFCVYIGAVFARLARLVAGCAAGKQLPPNTCERILSQATQTLSLAPMISVLMIGARLRAIQLERPNGDPPRAVQLCMYASSGAFFARLALEAAFGGTPSSQASSAAKTACLMTSCVVYGGCAVIAIGMFNMDGPPGHNNTPPLLTMMQCSTALVGAYLLESLALEVLAFSLAAQNEAKLGGQGQQEQGSSAGSGNSSSLEYERLMKAVEEKRLLEQKKQLESQPIFLQFPLMLCVLLVGITLRAVQLRLDMPLWSCVVMYVTTGAIIFQAAWAGVAAALRVFLGPATPQSPGFSWRQHCDGPPQLWQMLGGSGSEAADGVPASPDAGAGPKAKDPLGPLLAMCWGIVTASLYLGTVLILASVFAMEAEPLSILTPSVLISAVPQGGRRSEDGVPPVSVAMRCVMLLTLLYFGIYLVLMLGGFVRGSCAKWTASVLSGIQRSLAFVPMLCIMMIAVRLRAMQLGVRDPPQWAQATMCVASGAIAIQVCCSLFPGIGGIDADELGTAPSAILGKVAAIVLLLVRHVASVTLYGAVAVLIVALVFMRST